MSRGVYTESVSRLGQPDREMATQLVQQANLKQNKRHCLYARIAPVIRSAKCSLEDTTL